MKRVIVIYILTILSSLVVIAEMTVPPVREVLGGSPLFLAPFAVLFLFSLFTVVFTIRGKIEGTLRTFLLITGGSGGAIFVSILLHNFIYGIFVHFFGEDIWSGVGGDEPVFFILGLVVFPVLYLVGAIGSAVNLVLRSKK
jgi:predicted small integral membrane protein